MIGCGIATTSAVTVRAQAKGGAGGFVLAGGSAFAVLTSVFIAGGASAFALSASGFFAGDASDGGTLSEVTGFSTAGSFAADGVCA